MKQGVEYFPLDTALDAKFELLEAGFGIKGFGVVVKLLQKIYGEQGYYVELDKDIILVVAHKWGVSANLVSDIVARAIEVGIFDRNMYKKYGILTSKGIQERYFKMTKKRAFLNMRSEYLLVQVTQNPENAVFKAKNDVQNGQSKGKESKKEKDKKKYGEFENVFLADEEYGKLFERFGEKEVKKRIETLSAYIESSGKQYKSHYATILNWARKDGIIGENRSSGTGYNGIRRFN